MDLVLPTYSDSLLLAFSVFFCFEPGGFFILKFEVDVKSLLFISVLSSPDSVLDIA